MLRAVFKEADGRSMLPVLYWSVFRMFLKPKRHNIGLASVQRSMETSGRDTSVVTVRCYDDPATGRFGPVQAPGGSLLSPGALDCNRDQCQTQ